MVIVVCILVTCPPCMQASWLLHPLVLLSTTTTIMLPSPKPTILQPPKFAPLHVQPPQPMQPMSPRQTQLHPLLAGGVHNPNTAPMNSSSVSTAAPKPAQANAADPELPGNYLNAGYEPSIAGPPAPPRPTNLTLREAFALINPAVNESTFDRLRLGLSIRTLPASSFLPHLTAADYANYLFFLALRDVLLTLLHTRATEEEETEAAAVMGGGDERFYILLEEFLAAERKVHEYWRLLGKSFPPPLREAFTRFKKALMLPPGASGVEEVVMAINWAFLILVHLEQPARRWVEERFPGLCKGRVFPWESFLRVMKAGFGGGTPRVRAEVKVPEDGLDRARHMAEAVLSEDWWECDPERRYTIDV
ncbi:hypothetical protein FN846DRAFT_550681 [Sphaerosporella brunnea]|uniref:Uncharacterized protein n=1 Tax=Sphaerosporella brunnea TaxID=1250544 RepID=A0A5J5EE73_9PEZI|nr:hypothetical protein FN846DRAFT_550681 [Sphaerosporella brunnea]